MDGLSYSDWWANSDSIWGPVEADVTLAAAMGRIEVLPPVLAHGDTQARSALVLAGALIGLATWLVLERHPRWGGVGAAFSAALLAFGSVRASYSPDRVLRFLDSVLDRAYDGAILPAVALAMRHEDMVVSALAVVAIGLSFVAAYVMTKGKSLGYVVRDSTLVRAGRYVALAAGLLAGGLLPALVAVLVLTAFTATDNARQVLYQDR